MADLTQVYDALRKADAAGDTAAAQKLAAYIRQNSAASPKAPAEQPVNPATDFGGDTLQVGPFDTHIPIGQDTQNFIAGWGKGVTDLGRGAGQAMGLVSRQNVADSRARDAALQATKAGRAGDILGTGATMLPTAFIPGAATLGGAAAIGGGTGLLQPSTSTGETLLNTGVGAAAGPASLLVGRGLGALYQGARAAVEPFFQGGQERIASRTLQSFAGGPQEAQAAVGALQAPRTLLPGVQPTTAELANNAGIAQLERTVANNPEALTAMTARQQANQAAVTGAVRGLAGNDVAMTGARNVRSAMADPLYEAARNTTVPADADLGRLLARPSLRNAWTRAQQLAEENGETLAQPGANDISGRTLQYLRMALSDTANSGPQAGMGAHELRALRGTLQSLNTWIESNVPTLRQADQAFALGSRPINRMEIGQALQHRLEPALSDFQAAPTRVNAASFANAVRNGDQLAANATGNARATLAGTMTPDQMQSLQLAGEQLARRATAQDLGRAIGSNTGQNLASQNVLRQLLGPLGLPQGMGERAASSTLGQTVLRPLQWAAQTGEPRVVRHLAHAMLDPDYAARLLSRPQGSQAARLLWERQGLLGSVGNTAALGLLGSGNAAQQ